ncbi:unnamed protein product [Hermetia illucens]|uniref:MAGUK p55 subfamily member 6 n=2 Tax=Hermetia illucens TaxID=343691 RepID=A0A7R8YS35_HERIL|nr:MAGUK p55 subfamily member 6 isoform X1 [Hermetia illucens]CAD7080129.1 unnamed protein product [Hermetia illucens]
MVRLSRKEKQDKVELLASLNRLNNQKSGASENDAFHHLQEHSHDPNGDELIFMQGLLHNPAVTQDIRVEDLWNHHQPDYHPIETNSKALLDDTIRACNGSSSTEAGELSNLLKSPHIKALLSSHDEIGEIIDSESKEGHLFPIEYLNSDMPAETIKMVGLRRKPNEPLGLTVEVDDHNQLMVARILAGGIIDKQGMLHPGDVILEVNGVPVNTPEELQAEVSKSKESLTLKIGPNVDEEIKSARLTMSGGQVKNAKNLEPGKKLTCYMRALFDYNPEEDTLLPCQDIGVAFKHGDILQIINVKDPNWWQAKNLSNPESEIGLIPSQELEERRKAYVPPEADYVHKIGICGTRISKRKKKTMYKSMANCDFDKADLMLYEEVTRMPPFKRKTLALVGVRGVGRRTLKNRLVNSDPDKFGAVIPHTSRPPRALEESGKGYWFVDREEMEEEIKENKFLEYGEYNGNLYGTHLDSIRDVIKSGKMCILDCAPSALKILHNSTELMPFVVFVAAPGMEQLKQIYAEKRATGGSSRNLTFDRQSSIRYSSRRARTLESLASLYEDEDLISTVEESSILQRKYEKYFDMVIVNEDFDETFRKVIEALDQLSHEHQWVPVNWIY